jgi:uncharacterized protein
MTQRKLEDLPPDECYALLRTARVGRLVYDDGAGPVAEPVNYAVAGTDIVFRIEGGAKRDAVRQPNVAFEVDHVDDDMAGGWSVIARGTGREVPLEEVSDVLRRIEGAPPVPWALGVHNVWLQLHPTTVSGRRLGAASMSASA